MRLLSQQLPCQRRQTAASKRLFHCLKCTWSTWSGNVHLQFSNKESPFNMLFSITRLHNSTWKLFVDCARGTHWRHFGGGMKLAGALHRSPVVSAILEYTELMILKFEKQRPATGIWIGKMIRASMRVTTFQVLNLQMQSLVLQLELTAFFC